MKSIRAKLVTLLLCCVILSSAIIGFVCIQQTSSILQETAKDNMVLLCEKNARELNTVFGSIENSVDTLAHYVIENLPSTDILLNGAGADYEDYFTKINQVGTNHASSLSGVVAVYTVFDPAKYESKGFFYQADAQGKLISYRLPAIPIAGREESDWWNTPIQKGQATWIGKSLQKSTTDKARIFSYVVPIYHNNTFLGVVGMDFSYTILHEMISGIRLMETGFGTVLDRDGYIVAHPRREENEIVTNPNEDFSLIAAKFASTQAAAFEAGEYNLDKALSSELFPYEQEGEERMLTMCTLQNGMILCLSAPVREIFAQQTRMINTTIMGVLLISLIVLLVAAIFANRLSAPIIELNKAARLFIEGDLNTAVTRTTKDEIGELAESFEKTRVRMKSYIDELYSEAHIDSLTGTHNKSAFSDEEKELNARIEAGDASFCVALFDVNYLKITNDTFGHIVGDDLLIKIANCMKNAFGPQNVFRLGGDEFAALIYAENEDEGMARATQCIAEIERSKLDNYPDIPVSCAMGVAAFCPESDKTLGDVLSRADKMMYQNKAEIKKSTPFWQKDLLGMRQVQIERYLEFLKTLSQSMDAFPFLLDINSDTNWFFNHVNQNYAICKNDSPTNTLKEMMEIVHPDDREALRADLKRIADGTSLEHNMNYRWINRKGESVWVNCHGKVINDTNGKPFLLIGRVSDTLLRPWYNPLTGLFNKAKLAVDYRNGTLPPFKSFVLINIDNLSHINLKHGRKYGDDALRFLAEALTESFKGVPTYHLEKDHFALLLDSRDIARIRGKLEALQLTVEERISISAAVLPNEKKYYADTDGIYDYARHLLKANKSEGGGVISFFSEEDFAKTISDIELIEELEASIYERDYEGFHLCYQPQVDARTHKVVSAEVLLRYTSPAKGMLFPDVFIPLLERTQLIREVGVWVLKRAIEQCVAWRKVNPDMEISVNVSPVQLKDEFLADTVLTLLAHYNLPENALTLELTESVELEDAAYTENFAKLRRAGVHISIDDFGTGYANLGYLKKISADEIKIDRLFVKDLKQGSFHHALITNIADFAKNNGLRLCVEGVETPQELAVLELNDPDLLQGYLFDKPLLTEEFEARYVTPHTEPQWQFEDELKKQRERVRFAYFDAKDILAKIGIGLWTMQIDTQKGTGKIYTDAMFRQIVGMEDSMSPAACYKFIMERMCEGEFPRVAHMMNTMRENAAVVQLEYDWMHPTREKVRMRCTGKFIGEQQNGILLFEGFQRVISDQRELSD